MLSHSEIFKIVGAFSTTKLSNNFEEDAAKVIEDLENNFKQFLTTSLNSIHQIYKISSPVDSSILKYLFISLECLVNLKDHLKKQINEADRLLSVAQQKCIRSLLERVVYLGISLNLLPNVEPLNQVPPIFSPPETSDIQKYEYLCLVTLVLVNLYQDDTFHGLLLPQFLSPILCGLCQLTMVPLKKTTDTYSRLQRERLIFQNHLDQLVSNLYQPMIVKELMVIEGNKDILKRADALETNYFILVDLLTAEKCPRWLKRGVGVLLTRQLHRPQGVKAVVEAVRDASNSAAPSSPAILEAMARVVVASPDLAVICPQILELLDSSDPELVRFAVICAKTLQRRDPRACDQFLLQSLTRSLTHPPSSEQDLTLCLKRLHKCFAVPASDFWCLPLHLLHKYIQILFRLNCKIFQSVSHLRNLVEDLFWIYLSKCEDNVLGDIFRCLILKEEYSDILINNGVTFEFGDAGGVKVLLKDSSNDENDEESLEEYGDCLMIILERRDERGDVGYKLFLTLLEIAVDEKEIDTLNKFERQLVTIKLLAVLADIPAIQKSLCKNPKPVVRFLAALIDKFVTGRGNEIDIISTVLVVLNVILHDFIYSNNSSGSWEVFCELETPLFNLKSKSENEELKLLAQEAYEVIMTHGAMKPKENINKLNFGTKDCTNRVQSKKSTTCDEALKDACDPLLPVRGHAMMQLGKLLATGNKQAKAKKEQILCIFQENLKHEDSFLYLSAIEGLSVAAAEFPDTVIITLAEQFCCNTLKTDTRLKVGEALVRVTKLLGDLVPVYKTELTNALLTGTRDNDPLVRASSLSGLGELCRILGFRVGSILTEVLMCARCLFSSDPSVEVRRAAVMLVSLLLKGLHKDALVVLQDVLIELYQSLKRIYSSDKDDVIRLHAQIALEELNSGTLAFLFPKPQLSKKITILDPLS